MQIIYELKYRPTTAGDWYGLDRVQRSYQSIIKGIVFNDHTSIDTLVSNVSDKHYKLSELNRFPIDDRSYPAIIRWASTKRGFRRAAFTYAKRLKYEGMLTYPAIMAALYAINEKLPLGDRIKARTLEKLYADILTKSDQWDTKLSKEALRAVRSDLGRQRGEQLTAEKENRINQINEAIKTGSFTKPSGGINKTKIAEYLGLDRRTVYSLLPLALAMLVILLWIRPTLCHNPIFPILQDKQEWGEVA